mgnify:FL=1
MIKKLLILFPFCLAIWLHYPGQLSIVEFCKDRKRDSLHFASNALLHENPILVLFMRSNYIISDLTKVLIFTLLIL